MRCFPDVRRCIAIIILLVNGIFLHESFNVIFTTMKCRTRRCWVRTGSVVPRQQVIMSNNTSPFTATWLIYTARTMPRKHEAFTRGWANAGPLSATLAQHYPNLGWMLRVFRVVLFRAVDWCSCFTRKIQHGGDWERPRPQARKNFHNFLLTVRTLSWACDLVPEMLLI